MTYADEKQYGSAKYHGMKVGGIHHWTYPDGQWTERKVSPDRWEVTYTSLKRRNKKAPKGSGAETGSGYHWLIIAHQWVEKLDANTYSTQLEGSKSLVAFKKPDWPVWNTQFRNSRRHAKEKTIAALEEAIARIRAGALDLEDPQDSAALPALAARVLAETFERESEDKTMARPEVKHAAPRDGQDEKEEGGAKANRTKRQRSRGPRRRRQESGLSAR